MQSKKKLLFFLFFITSAHFYILKLIKLSSTAGTPLNHLPTIPCTAKPVPYMPHKLSHNSTFHDEEPLTLKELNLLSKVIKSTKKPNRNLLFFGLNPQFLPLAEANTAVFLEDDAELIQTFQRRVPERVAIYKVSYKEDASRAYELLMHGRDNADCRRKGRRYAGAGGSSCRLAMAGLPQRVYEESWDVVVVDGPRGHRHDAPGRMAAIYTAGVLARMGNETDVVVHDVDRVIEKWYSWEFLCPDNLVSAKGRLWHFRVQGSFLSDGFCETKRVHIM